MGKEKTCINIIGGSCWLGGERESDSTDFQGPVVDSSFFFPFFKSKTIYKAWRRGKQIQKHVLTHSPFARRSWLLTLRTCWSTAMTRISDFTYSSYEPSEIWQREKRGESIFRVARMQKSSIARLDFVRLLRELYLSDFWNSCPISTMQQNELTLMERKQYYWSWIVLNRSLVTNVLLSKALLMSKKYCFVDDAEDCKLVVLNNGRHFRFPLLIFARAYHLIVDKKQNWID